MTRYREIVIPAGRSVYPGIYRAYCGARRKWIVRVSGNDVETLWRNVRRSHFA